MLNSTEPEICWICKCPKGQGEGRCAGHYETAPIVILPSPPAELDLTRTRREMLHHEDLPTS